VVLMTVAALAIRLVRLDYRGMWTDEFHTLDAVLRPWGELIIERLRSGHLPTYFIFMKVWTALFGTSDWALRLPSALAGALIVPATVWFVRPWLTRRMAWVVIAVACVNGTTVWASQEARMYSMLVVAATFAHGAFMRAAFAGERRAWLVYWVAAILGTALQPVMALWVIAHGVVAVRSGKRSSANLRAWLVGLAVALVLALVLAAFQHEWAINQHNIHLRQLLRVFVRNSGIYFTRLGLLGFGVSADTGRWRILTAIIVVTALGLAWWRWRRECSLDQSFAVSPEGRIVSASAWLVGLPVAMLFAASLFVEHIAGNERYMIAAFVPLWTLGVWGASGLRSGRARDALIVLTAVFLVVGLVRHWEDRGMGGREIVRYVNRHALPDDVIVCHATATVLRMVEHYSARPLKICAVPEPRPKYGVTAEQAYSVLLQCMGERKRMWLVEYRGKGSLLRQLLTLLPEEFELVRERTIEQARAVLVVRKAL
jgi:4-amino-4-deoxy-L-arabinose transferase-like glycosyltransferase